MSRALAWGEIDELKATYGESAAYEPLPDPSITKPNLVVKPHRNAQPSGAGTGEIANKQEI